jgi:hypothetical protein
MNREKLRILIKEVIKEIAWNETPFNATPKEVTDMIKRILEKAQQTGGDITKLTLTHSVENDDGIPTWWFIGIKGNEEGYFTFDNYSKGWLFGENDRELDDDNKINYAIIEILMDIR